MTTNDYLTCAYETPSSSVKLVADESKPGHYLCRRERYRRMIYMTFTAHSASLIQLEKLWKGFIWQLEMYLAFGKAHLGRLLMTHFNLTFLTLGTFPPFCNV